MSHISSIPIQTRPLHALLQSHSLCRETWRFVQVFFKSPPYDHSIGTKWKTLSDRSCGKSVHHQLAIEWMKMAKPAKPRFGGRELARLSAYHLMSEAPVGSAPEKFQAQNFGNQMSGCFKNVAFTPSSPQGPFWKKWPHIRVRTWKVIIFGGSCWCAGARKNPTMIDSKSSCRLR